MLSLPDLADLKGFFFWLFLGAPQVAAWGGLASLVVLYYYTRYTRRMMVATEATMRTTQRPVLQAVDVERQEDTVYVVIRNCGFGPALNLSRWVERRSNTPGTIPRRPGFIPPARHHEENSHLEVVGSNAEERIVFQHRRNPVHDWEEVLLIIHAEDIGGNRYQNAVKIRLSDEEDRMVWQSLSEQLRDDANDEEHPFVQWVMRVKTQVQDKVKEGVKNARK